MKNFFTGLLLVAILAGCGSEHSEVSYNMIVAQMAMLLVPHRLGIALKELLLALTKLTRKPKATT